MVQGKNHYRFDGMSLLQFLNYFDRPDPQSITIQQTMNEHLHDRNDKKNERKGGHDPERDDSCTDANVLQAPRPGPRQWTGLNDD